MVLPTRALSIRAPWWWFILHAGKHIENRDWRTDYRGPVLIHASAWWSGVQVRDLTSWAVQAALKSGAPLPAGGPPTLDDIRKGCGHIVGVADIRGCVDHSTSPWFFGRYGFVLRNPRPIEPIACKGALGFFKVPDDVLARIDTVSATPHG